MSGTEMQMAAQQAANQQQAPQPMQLPQMNRMAMQPSMQGYRPAPNPFARMPQLNQMQSMPMPNTMAARFNGGQMQPVPATPWQQMGMPMGGIQQAVAQMQAQQAEQERLSAIPRRLTGEIVEPTGGS